MYLRMLHLCDLALCDSKTCLMNVSSLALIRCQHVIRKLSLKGTPTVWLGLAILADAISKHNGKT
jgi:hypothetical protein